jgi:hypothetical protein
VYQGFRIHFGHNPHVNNDIRCWIKGLAGHVREIAMDMPDARRKFGLVLASVKDSNRMPQEVKPSDRVGSSESRPSKNQYAHS